MKDCQEESITTMKTKWNKRRVVMAGGFVVSCLYLLQYSRYELGTNTNVINTQKSQYDSSSRSIRKYPTGVIPKPNLGNSRDGGRYKCAMNIAIILCQDSHESLKSKANANSQDIAARDFSRQINQTVVMLKSIALQTRLNSLGNDSECINVIVLSDTKGHYMSVINRIDKEEKWAEDFRKRIKFSYVHVKYPTGSQWMRKLFRPCATLRLFLAELLPGYDSIIYLDTDIIFLQSIQNLWSEFKKFSSGKSACNENCPLAAMAPCLFHYGSKQNEIPYYGSSGLNAGIMLMNLTKMRNSLWTHKIRMVTTMFQNKIKLADQDILNVYFHFFPEHLHLLSCDWNFRPFQCRQGGFCEDASISSGISALHGNALSFTSFGPEPLFFAIYETFRKLKLDGNFTLEYFLEDLNFNLIETEEANRVKATLSECTNWGRFTSLALMRFEKLLNKHESGAVDEIVYFDYANETNFKNETPDGFISTDFV